jgi:hypothetical protein
MGLIILFVYHKGFLLFFRNACLSIVVDYKEMSGFIHLAEFHIEQSFIFIVPNSNQRYQ